jgi:putative hydrolase of the HAD superfamily
LALIRDLAAEGVPLAMLSNAPSALADAICMMPVAEDFGHLLFSCDLKLAKPDLACYGMALARIGAVADEVIFLDDRPENVAAAASLGLRTVLFTSPEQARAAIADELRAVC